MPMARAGAAGDERRTNPKANAMIRAAPTNGARGNGHGQSARPQTTQRDPQGSAPKEKGGKEKQVLFRVSLACAHPRPRGKA